jgi:glycosyltransferase involved in cell wall biosynthesis|tara:strand:+ start:142 stop:876 length:735 start_codon:yes stop_codon:yes gene_type:complete
MPAYNAEEFIGEAIQSVLNQTYHNWELIIVNDGSIDKTKHEISKFTDKRIKYFEQVNNGVSSARNTAIRNMGGDFFCFLDADDIYSENSLSSRVKVFLQEEHVIIVDGRVEVRDILTNMLIKVYQPDFRGNALSELIRLNEKCFFGPSCMIKRLSNKTYMFKEGLTHGEDLLFYISIANEGFYSYTNDLVMIYRSGNKSAMSNLRGLEKGYFEIYDELRKMPAISSTDLKIYKNKITSIPQRGR